MLSKNVSHLGFQEAEAFALYHKALDLQKHDRFEESAKAYHELLEARLLREVRPRGQAGPVPGLCCRRNALLTGVLRGWASSRDGATAPNASCPSCRGFSLPGGGALSSSQCGGGAVDGPGPSA